MYATCLVKLLELLKKPQGGPLTAPSRWLPQAAANFSLHLTGSSFSSLFSASPPTPHLVPQLLHQAVGASSQQTATPQQPPQQQQPQAQDGVPESFYK